MNLNPAFLILSAAFYFTLPGYSQCTITPQTTISGKWCAGSELLITSNSLPESIVWKRDGSIVSTQIVTLLQNATTVAGGKGPGNNSDQLNNPDRLYVDAAGAVYVPDFANNRIQKWLPGATTGITVAGGNGKGSAANQFDRCSSVFVDQQGNLYVADQNNRRVQKWAPGASSGVTVAGANGDLLLPTDVFVDKYGNLYVSDQYQNVVKKYPSGSGTGVVVAGDYSYSGSAEGLNGPTGIFVDDAGNLYICDTNNNRVQKWAAGATSGTTIVGGSADIMYPLDVSVDCKGNVYVADYGNNRIQKYISGSSAGITVAGGNGQGNSMNQLSNPVGVFIVGDNYLYVADFANHRVQRFSNNIDMTFIPPVPGNYNVTVNYSCCPAYNESFEIYETQKPLVNITATDTNICPGAPVELLAENTNQILEPIYHWKLNGTDIGNNSQVYNSMALQNGDKLQCILTSQRACTLPLSDTSNLVEMKVFKPVPFYLGEDIVMCPGSDTVLKAPSTYVSYLWQGNSSQPLLWINKAGRYILTVNDACNNTFSDTVSVSYFKLATNFLPADTTLCSWDMPILTSKFQFSSYLWNNQSTGPTYPVTRAGLYWLQAKDENNCITVDSVFIQTKACPLRGIYVPNAFSPNNDQVNDLFKPIVYGTMKKYRFSVYDRYGQVVFNTSDPAKGWNGTFKGNPPVSGTFVWFCQYELAGLEPKVEKGTVVLIK